MEVSIRLFNELEERFNYKLVNKQPLLFIPKAKMVLYCVDNGLNLHVFRTSEERDNYLENCQNSYNKKVRLDYIGNLANRNNVINMVYENTKENKLVSIIDNNSYYNYDYEESKKRGKYMWNRYIGNLREIYSEFEKQAYFDVKIKFR